MWRQCQCLNQWLINQWRSVARRRNMPGGGYRRNKRGWLRKQWLCLRRGSYKLGICAWPREIGGGWRNMWYQRRKKQQK